MRRGDLVTVTPQGDHGKPRPALVIQSDQFPEMATVTVLLVTFTLVEAPLIRISLEPSGENNLRKASQVIIDKVPAGFLLGFMRRWRTSPGAPARPKEASTPQRAPDPQERDLHDQIKAAPSSNRQFHASDLCRVIGQAAYEARVLDVIRQFGCPRFTATLAVHGTAVLAGEIAR